MLVAAAPAATTSLRIIDIQTTLLKRAKISGAARYNKCPTSKIMMEVQICNNKLTAVGGVYSVTEAILDRAVATLAASPERQKEAIRKVLSSNSKSSMISRLGACRRGSKRRTSAGWSSRSSPCSSASPTCQS